MKPMSEENDSGPAAPGQGGQEEQELTTAEILGWLEFSCWTMLLLAPVLYYVNGPSVSTDQLVVRSALVVLSALGAGVLRLINWRGSKYEPVDNG